VNIPSPRSVTLVEVETEALKHAELQMYCNVTICHTLCEGGYLIG